MQIEELVQLVVDALEELKAKDIVKIDVREHTSVTDYMIIASGSSNRQVKALADNVVEKAKDAGRQPMGVEGKESGEWVWSTWPMWSCISCSRLPVSSTTGNASGRAPSHVEPSTSRRSKRPCAFA